MSTKNKLQSNIHSHTKIDMIKNNSAKKLISYITSGQDLWEKREDLYPNLVFCKNVKDQMYSNSEKVNLNAIMLRLNPLQEYFNNYGGVFNAKDMGFELEMNWIQ